MRILVLLVITECSFGAPSGKHKEYYSMDTGDMQEAMAYLQKFGYLELKNLCAGNCLMQNEGKIVGALKKFQESMSLKITGYLDGETRKVMKKPRCVQPDSSSIRKKRYVIEGTRSLK
uniref:Peptidoglycan binding-like domain-containing protein n=1 Tax=Romanomermis culicivorax TaxID=13658 RepID=A0A915JFB6_ROMCU